MDTSGFFSRWVGRGSTSLRDRKRTNMRATAAFLPPIFFYGRSRLTLRSNLNDSTVPKARRGVNRKIIVKKWRRGVLNATFQLEQEESPGGVRKRGPPGDSTFPAVLAGRRRSERCG